MLSHTVIKYPDNLLLFILEEEYKESYESYDATMNCLTEDQTSQSHILVALAAITYLFNEVEDAKILLFRRLIYLCVSLWQLAVTLFNYFTAHN